MSNTAITQHLKLTTDQLTQWYADRVRQSAIGTNDVGPSRGDHMRRLNTGIAYRTYLLNRRARCAAAFDARNGVKS